VVAEGGQGRQRSGDAVMLARTGTLVVALGCLLAPAQVRAQEAHHHDVEVIKPPKEPPPKARADVEKVTAQIVERTNAFRKEEGRAKVEVNQKLSKAAHYFADFMARNDRYGHSADGNQPAGRAKKYGYDYCIVLENIAYQYNSKDFETEALAKAFVEAWKKSPGHRKNMLDPDVTHTGVAVARSEKTGFYYAVQMFGRPHSLAIEFEISNRTEAEVSYRIGEETFRLFPRYTRTHTRCRPPVVTVELPGEKGGRKTLKPASGDHFVVAGKEGAYQVTKE
jgi:uncharacterized protein YkwD